jgi:hypothetical protein
MNFVLDMKSELTIIPYINNCQYKLGNGSQLLNNTVY